MQAASEVLVVGQDWGDVAYFERWRGIDQPSGNPTNENLRRLLGLIGARLGSPREHQDLQVFLTNLILCLKTGGLQAPVRDEWLRNCTRELFAELVRIVRPLAVLALRQRVTSAILDYYGVPYCRTVSLSELTSHAPFRIGDDAYLFPVYHCGAGGVNRNRSFAKQCEDWQRIGAWLAEHRGSVTGSESG